MSSLDVRDMLDLPQNAGPRPTKKQKLVGPRTTLKGLQREVAGLGGDNPIAIVPEIPLFKKRRLANRKPASKWDLKPFKNSARKDGLILRHWRRKEDAPATVVGDGNSAEEDVKGPEIDDSMFAKYNVQVNIPAYNEEQYTTNLKNPDWTKEETDYLMGLVQDFDLRWPVIWDRYDYEPAAHKEESIGDSQALVLERKARSVEDLKARYYEVAAKMMAVHRPVQHMSQTEFSLHSLMSSFNTEQERTRKKFAEALMARSPEERKEEENLLIELKRIMARTDKLNEERKELYARLEAPPSTASSTNLAVYTTSAGLSNLVQQLMTADKSKKRKSLLGVETASPAPSGPSGPSRESVDRRDSIRDSVSAPPGKKAGPAASTPTERRELTKEEKITYGVTYHDRLTGGPTFRHERVQRQITMKSAVQAAKIQNILVELDIPARLVMPTAEVVSTFENLLGSINSLIDQRKVAEKLDGEIKQQEAMNAERERKARRERGEFTPEGEGKDGQEEEKTKVEEEDGDRRMEDVEANESAVPEENGDKEGDDDAGDGDGHANNGEENEESAVASTRASSAAHKRSASVLSQASDKSMKRQRK